MLVHRRDYAGALAFFQRLERLQPRGPAAVYALYKNLGWANLGLRNYLLAERQLRQALTVDPQGAAAYCLLGMLLEERPTPDRAAALQAWSDCLRYEYAGDIVAPEHLQRARERLLEGGSS
jgi:tetratricopeptide (TPR) repeat protein